MPQPFEGTTIGAWTPATSPLARTRTLRRCRTIYHSLPSTPYTLRDYTTPSSPILPTPQPNSRDLYRGVKGATSKGGKHFGPPLGGYEHKKLDYNLKHKSAGPIKIGDKRGPNSDLGGGKPYEKEVKDSTGDVIMQESIWTTAEKTSFLVSISHSHRETSAYGCRNRDPPPFSSAQIWTRSHLLSSPPRNKALPPWKSPTPTLLVQYETTNSTRTYLYTRTESGHQPTLGRGRIPNRTYNS